MAAPASPRLRRRESFGTRVRLAMLSPISASAWAPVEGRPQRADRATHTLPTLRPSFFRKSSSLRGSSHDGLRACRARIS
eukprot:4330368-Pyramimonas_sp.AAC.1